VVVGRADVAREVRAAGPLLADLAAPVTARSPWLTAALNAGSTGRGAGRPVAVVVGTRGPERPDAVAFLHLRRRGPVTSVTVLGDAVGPRPGGRPWSRLPARDAEAAGLLAAGVDALLASLRTPWRLELAGLPMGDPTARSLAARMLDGRIANVRSTGLVDDLDQRGSAVRSRDPRVLERWLPQLLAGVPDPRDRAFLRAAARLHAALGELEVAVLAEAGADPGAVRTVLLTLVDGSDRWPWWAVGPETLPTAPGAPLVGLSVPGRGRLAVLPRLRSLGAGR
jgi:hypothetical protein